MKQIFIIFKKDVIDTLRDKRALMRMILVPLLLFPLIFGVTNTIQNSSTEKEKNRALRVGYLAEGEDLGLHGLLSMIGDFQLSLVPHHDSIKEWIRESRLDVGVYVGASFADQVETMHTGTIETFGTATSYIAKARLDSVMDVFEKQLISIRLDSLHLSPENIKPVDIRFQDTATLQESIGKIAGGFLPYIFIIFCYMGCMFPAIDLFTGEKERSTIETLLSAPIDRWKILIGKMLVIICAGLTSAALSILGLFIGLKLAKSDLGGLVDLALNIVSPTSIAALLLMLLPLVVFFAGIMIPATVYAKSFKEAAVTLQPLNFVVILPAVIGMMPGIALNVWTAMIPILNVVLATKEIIAGTMNWWLFTEVVASLMLFATGAVLLSFRGFGNEKNILRS